MESFFSEDNNIYSNNIITLFKYFNEDEHFIKNNFNLLKNNNNFIEFILPNETYLKQAFEYDQLYIYKIIDFFNSRYNVYDLKKKNVYELLNNKNYSTIEYIWNSLKDFNIELTNENLINKIQNNADEYFFFLLNQLWLKKNEQKVIDNENLQTLGEQILICYYYNMFYTKNKDFLINKKTNYENFLKIINVYNNNFKIDYEDKNISFNPIPKNEKIICNSNLNKLKLFFYFALENKIINKNIIIWFFIFFKQHITKQLQNDYLSIIYNTNPNLIGFINNLFKTFKKEYYEYTEEEIEEIFESFKNDEYIFKLEDDDVMFENDIDLFKITNNIFLLKDLNKRNDEVYSFIKTDFLDTLKIENLFFIFLLSPLENSLDTIVEQIKDITHHVFHTLKEIGDKNPFYFYNSCILKNFNTIDFFFDNDKIFSSNLNNFSEIENYFDIEVLFLKILFFLNNYEIIPKLNLNLKKNINYYKFDLHIIKKIYLTIYPFEKNNLDGYQKS